MVSFIQLAIPPGMESVYNPIGDAAFMKKIGAKPSRRPFLDKTKVGSVYELKDATTGAIYVFLWWSQNQNSQHFCGIEKI